MRIVVALLLLVASGSASADYFTGNDLQHLLTSGRLVDITMGRGYVAGVLDTFGGQQLYCVPENVRLSQASAVVKKYLSDNPRLWNKPAKVLVVNAFKLAYPCR